MSLSEIQYEDMGTISNTGSVVEQTTTDYEVLVYFCELRFETSGGVGFLKKSIYKPNKFGTISAGERVSCASPLIYDTPSTQ